MRKGSVARNYRRPETGQSKAKCWGNESKCAEIEKSVDEEASSRTCKSKHVVGKINKAELNEVQTTEANKSEKEKYEKSIKKQKKSNTAVPSNKESIESSTTIQDKKGIKAKTAIKSKSWADMAEEEDEESVVGIIGKATDNSTELTNDSAKVGINIENRKMPDTVTIDGRTNELPAKQRVKDIKKVKIPITSMTKKSRPLISM